MRVSIHRPATLVLVALVAGCGLTPQPPATSESRIPTSPAEIHRPAPGPEFVLPQTVGQLKRLLLVFDSAGLLEGVRDARVAGKDDRIWSQPMQGNPNALVMGWAGGTCTSRPTISLDQHGSAVTLTVWDGFDPLPPGQACAGVGIDYQVELVLVRPIAAFDFTLLLDEGPRGD